MCFSARSALPPPLRGRVGRGVSRELSVCGTPTPDLESELRSPRTPQGGGESHRAGYLPNHFGGRFSENAFGPSM